jgi:hypothetical protein
MAATVALTSQRSSQTGALLTTSTTFGERGIRDSNHTEGPATIAADSINRSRGLSGRPLFIVVVLRSFRAVA